MRQFLYIVVFLLSASCGEEKKKPTANQAQANTAQEYQDQYPGSSQIGTDAFDSADLDLSSQGFSPDAQGFDSSIQTDQQNFDNSQFPTDSGFNQSGAAPTFNGNGSQGLFSGQIIGNIKTNIQNGSGLFGLGILGRK